MVISPQHQTRTDNSNLRVDLQLHGGADIQLHDKLNTTISLINVLLVVKIASTVAFIFLGFMGLAILAARL